MDRENNTNSSNNDEVNYSSYSNQGDHQVQINDHENESFQSGTNNAAKIRLDSSARISNVQRSSSAGRSSSPPPPPSNQGNHLNVIQRRKSTPSWTLSREVKYIKKDRRKKNVEQMLVVFQNDTNDIGRWIDVADLNCPQLIEEYWIRKKQMKESNLNNANNGEKQSNPKKTGVRTIKEIIGMIPSPEYKYIYVVVYNDSTNEEYIYWKEMRKHYSKQLLKFYESHIDQENFIIAPPSSISPMLSEVHQIFQQQSQPQIMPPQVQQVQKQQQQQQQIQQPNLIEQIPELPQQDEPQEQTDANMIKEDEKENKDDTNNILPIFLRNQNLQNTSIPKIQMLQRQVQLQRMTSTPPPKEPSKASKPQKPSQFQPIQQNSIIMSRK